MAALLDLITRSGSSNTKPFVIEFVFIDLVEKVCYMGDGVFISRLRTTCHRS